MINVFYMGGPLFMGILTLLFLMILVMAGYDSVQILRNTILHETRFRHRLTYIKSLALFALVFGIFGQLIGLYQAFSVIEQMGRISPALLAGGLKVSTISTLYGITIFLLSYLIWFALDYWAQSKSPRIET